MQTKLWEFGSAQLNSVRVAAVKKKTWFLAGFIVELEIKLESLL
jgi:hypothetical protein